MRHDAAKSDERREAQVRFSLVRPPVGRGANQKPEEPLWNTRLATPLRAAFVPLFSLSRSHHPPVLTRFSGPLWHFFRAPATRAGALWRRDQSSHREFSPLEREGEALARFYKVVGEKVRLWSAEWRFVVVQRRFVGFGRRLFVAVFEYFFFVAIYLYAGMVGRVDSIHDNFVTALWISHRLIECK